jgi:hypothetical protein
MSISDNNPKAKKGEEKIPLGLFPPIAMKLISLVMQHGAKKYGLRNWRLTRIKESTYYHAMQRHLTSWFDGEDNDADSGLPHLAHVAASVAILLDAENQNVLDKDRKISAQKRLQIQIKESSDEKEN